MGPSGMSRPAREATHHILLSPVLLTVVPAVLRDLPCQIVVCDEEVHNVV